MSVRGGENDGKDSLRPEIQEDLNRDAMSPHQCVFRNIMRTSRTIAAVFDPALAPAGLTGHQFNLMMTLRQMGPLTVGKLASALDMDPSGIPRAIRPLTVKGFITVGRGGDRRERHLSLTAEGEAALARAEPFWEQAQADIVTALGVERWLNLSEELKALRRMTTGTQAPDGRVSPSGS